MGETSAFEPVQAGSNVLSTSFRHRSKKARVMNEYPDNGPTRGLGLEQGFR